MKSEVDKAGDRPAICKIEITAEMIECGLAHLYRYHPERGVSDEETVRKIFLEMCRLLPPPFVVTPQPREEV
jgi:hypothetical protein